jgi:hypothetical protein
MADQSKPAKVDEYPQGTTRPEPGDVVQVLMTEEMARRFEARCLGRENTKGDTSLSPPLKFSEDDLPTYIIDIGPGL